VDTYGTAKVKNADGQLLTDGQISSKISELFDMTPYAIVKRFGLKNPIFYKTAKYGHFGRDYSKEEVEVFYKDASTKVKTINGQEKYFKEVEFFAWEKLDYVDKIKSAFTI